MKQLSLEFTCTHFYPQIEKFVCNVRIVSLSEGGLKDLVLHKLQNSYQLTIKATDSNFIILYRYAATCFNQLCGHPQAIYINPHLPTWRIWWAPNNAREWQVGFNSAFKGL